MRTESLTIRGFNYAYNIKSGTKALEKFVDSIYPELDSDDFESLFTVISEEFFDMAEKLARVIFEYPNPGNATYGDGRSNGWLVLDYHLTEMPDLDNVEPRVITFFSIIEDMLKAEWWKESITNYIED